MEDDDDEDETKEKRKRRSSFISFFPAVTAATSSPATSASSSSSSLPLVLEDEPKPALTPSQRDCRSCFSFVDGVCRFNGTRDTILNPKPTSPHRSRFEASLLNSLLNSLLSARGNPLPCHTLTLTLASSSFSFPSLSLLARCPLSSLPRPSQPNDRNRPSSGGRRIRSHLSHR